jgi:predicted metal-binding protein
MDKYIRMAKELGMADAVIISPGELCFDPRTMLKCLWGCMDHFPQDTRRCSMRGTSYEQRVEIVKKYQHILVVHSHDAAALGRATLELERAAFLDGCYFAFAVRSCNLCENCCFISGEGTCPSPDKIRPCDQAFGIDVYKTVRGLGLPCNVLHSKEDVPNRYGFVLID